MCGIFGILASNGSIPPNLLERATDSLAHRGPDDTRNRRPSSPTPRRVSKSDWAAAGWRFSISRRSGHQPMQDPETGNWIVYNGEIYNFRELRTRLQGEGVRFVSQSDTEVLLKAYGRWGEKCLGELRGMFAFAIWDAKRSRLLLGRDPMGIKPLYYCSAGQYFLFASELRTLLGTGLVPRRLDPAGLINYLNFGSVYDPITMIAGVSALEAGHYAVWENGRLTRFDVLGPRTPRTGRHGLELSRATTRQRGKLWKRMYTPRSTKPSACRRSAMFRWDCFFPAALTPAVWLAF